MIHTANSRVPPLYNNTTFTYRCVPQWTAWLDGTVASSWGCGQGQWHPGTTECSPHASRPASCGTLSCPRAMHTDILPRTKKGTKNEQKVRQTKSRTGVKKGISKKRGNFTWVGAVKAVPAGRAAIRRTGLRKAPAVWDRRIQDQIHRFLDGGVCSLSHLEHSKQGIIMTLKQRIITNYYVLYC